MIIADTEGKMELYGLLYLIERAIKTNEPQYFTGPVVLPHGSIIDMKWCSMEVDANGTVTVWPPEPPPERCECCGK